MLLKRGNEHMDEENSEKPSEYVRLSEVAAELGLKTGTLYNFLHDLEIQTFKAGRDRHSYITREDATRMRIYKEQPWRFKVERRKGRRVPPD
jgi:hypothetical protein